MTNMLSRIIIFVSFYFVFVRSVGIRKYTNEFIKNINDNNEDTLVLTNIVFRHGDRTPDASSGYKNDPYANDTYYPYGLGELTLEGKENSFKLGESLRRRYKKFVPFYTPFHVESFSSYYGRAQMTLQCVHAALFPPTKQTEVKERLKWQPFFYRYLSTAEDNLIATFRSCPLIYEKLKESEKSAQDGNLLNELNPLFEYLTNHSGSNVESVSSLMSIHNSLKTQAELGYKLPTWTEQVYPEPLTSAAAWFWKLITSTTQLKKIIVGHLLKKIILDSENKANGSLKPSERKMFLYSGHDMNIAGILSALGHYDGEQLPYLAHVIFELHKINDVYGFKVFAQDHKTSNPRLLKIGDCDEFCPIGEFRAILEEYFPDPNWCSD